MVALEIASKDSAMCGFAKNLRETQQVVEETLDSLIPTLRPSIQSVEDAERLLIDIVAPEHLRDSCVDLYDLKFSDAGLSADQRFSLEGLAKARSLGQTSPCINAFGAGQAAAYKMFETIDRKPDIDVYGTNGLVLEDIEGDVELKDVHIKYPARPDVQIFFGFSLEIPRGTTVALVGESGSGKSTVISLIERFYDP